MKRSEVKKLAHGLYRIYWKEGGTSLASVGSNERGERWYAPTNWITVPWYDWKGIAKVDYLMGQGHCRIVPESK